MPLHCGPNSRSHCRLLLHLPTTLVRGCVWCQQVIGLWCVSWQASLWNKNILDHLFRIFITATIVEKLDECIIFSWPCHLKAQRSWASQCAYESRMDMCLRSRYSHDTEKDFIPEPGLLSPCIISLYLYDTGTRFRFCTSHSVMISFRFSVRIKF